MKTTQVTSNYLYRLENFTYTSALVTVLMNASGVHASYSILFYPITLECRRGTTDEFAAIPFHLALFADVLVELAKSIPVHSLTLSAHLFFCLPFFFFLSLCPVGLSLLNQKTLKHGKPSKLPFLDQGQEFVIFSNGCLNLSANLLIGNMVFVRNVQ